MFKKFIALTAFAFISIAGSNAAEAHWWTKVYHEAKHAIKHEAHVVAHGVDHAKKLLEKDAKAAAYKACLKGMPVVIEGVVGKACKAASVEVGLACNAALDAETSGLASVACTAVGVTLYATCTVEGGKVTRNMTETITHKACAKI